MNRILEDSLVVEGVDFVITDVVNGGSEKASGSGGGVEHLFSEPGRGHLRHELGDGAGRVVFALVPGVTKFDEDRFVNRAEDVAIFRIVEVEAVELVDDFAHRKARLHVIVHSIENFPNDTRALRGFRSL